MSATTTTSPESLRPDVLVIGAGVAGALAALSARSLGASVTLVHRAGGATPAWSGAVDIADGLVGLTPGDALSALSRGPSIVEAAERLAARTPRHPYARFAPRGHLAEALTAALTTLERAVGDLEIVHRDDGFNHVVATSLGTVKRAGAVARSQRLDLAELAEQDDARPGSVVVGVVEWMDLAGFNARPVVEMLRYVTGLGRERPLKVVPVVVPRQGDGAVFADTIAMARALSDEQRREAYVLALKEVLRFGVETTGDDDDDAAPTHLLTPPVLGLDGLDEDALAAIALTLGRPVREFLSLPPSTPGARLQRALHAACEEAGVTLIAGTVSAPILDGKRVRRVEVRRGEEVTSLEPGAVVLSSGRFFAGGIKRDGVATETIFGLPVVTDGRPVADQFIGTLTADQVDGDHAIFRAGVAVNDAQQPLDVDRQIIAENLFAAGTVLEGFDPARDGAGLMVAAWTGQRAGVHAARMR